MDLNKLSDKLINTGVWLLTITLILWYDVILGVGAVTVSCILFLSRNFFNDLGDEA